MTISITTRTAKARLLLNGVLALTLIPVLHATPQQQPKSTTYAQVLVQKVIDTHPGMLDVIFHVTPPDASENIAIAAYTAKEKGAKSGEDDLGVMRTAKPLIEVQKDGIRIGVLVPLKDQHGKTIGALGLMYPYKAGESQEVFLKRSYGIRDELAKQIASRDALFGTVRDF